MDLKEELSKTLRLNEQLSIYIETLKEEVLVLKAVNKSLSTANLELTKAQQVLLAGNK